jgi:hypothetical protein
MQQESSSAAIAMNVETTNSDVDVGGNSIVPSPSNSKTPSIGSQFTSPAPVQVVGLIKRMDSLSVSPPRRRGRDSTPPTGRRLDITTDDLVARGGINTPTITASRTSPNDSRKTPPAGNSPSAYLPQRPLLAPHNNDAHAHAQHNAPSARHYDLTPVTRNTWGSSGDKELLCLDGDRSTNQDGYGVVSPDDGAILHGEHLAMPSSLDAPSSNAHRLAGPALPPLPASRSKSVGNLDLLMQQSTTTPYQTTMDPFDFHSSDHRKFWSFTSRKQYEQYLEHEDPYAHAAAPLQQQHLHHRLTPYQPTRQYLSEIGDGPPQDELSRIFIARTTTMDEAQGNSGVSAVGGGATNANVGGTGLAPIPLGERQWSIPSIRMANALNGGGSIASYTSYTDEEDNMPLQGDDDDTNSLSSRGSLYLPDSSIGGEPLGMLTTMGVVGEGVQGEIFGGGGVNPLFALTGGGFDGQDQENNMNPPAPGRPNHTHPHQTPYPFTTTPSNCSNANNTNGGATADAIHGNAQERRRKKRSKKEQNAVEWLRTVEASDDVFAEAASSKFLTGGSSPHNYHPHHQEEGLSLKPAFSSSTLGNTNYGHDPIIPRSRIIRRQTSSPPTLELEQTGTGGTGAFPL